MFVSFNFPHHFRKNNGSVAPPTSETTGQKNKKKTGKKIEPASNFCRRSKDVMMASSPHKSPFMRRYKKRGWGGGGFRLPPLPFTTTTTPTPHPFFLHKMTPLMKHDEQPRTCHSLISPGSILQISYKSYVVAFIGERDRQQHQRRQR